MKIFLTDQSHRFPVLLKQLTGKPIMTFDKYSLEEKTTSTSIKTDKPMREFDLSFLYDYKIFPSNIMTFATQWEKEKRKIKIGDTILQQVFIPPIRFFSITIVFGVRINRIIDEVERKGFGYVTIEGHVEKGESTFTLETTQTGLVFKVKTFSKPGNLLTKLVGPLGCGE